MTRLQGARDANYRERFAYLDDEARLYEREIYLWALFLLAQRDSLVA